MLVQQQAMFQPQLESQAAAQYGSEGRVIPAARTLFSDALWRGRRSRLAAVLLRRAASLKVLQLTAKQKSRLHYVGLRQVAIDRITGTESRERGFDRRFHPTRPGLEERWARVASARYEGIPLPPVELIRVGDEYYVRDGHHRISVARARGEKDIDALIVLG